jgi:poly-gamma-glutamate capsule biosynthesis protein CapA/YwtB (metallophosphatase superfamily)
MARPLAGSTTSRGPGSTTGGRGGASRPPSGRPPATGRAPFPASTILIGVFAIAGIGLLVGAAVFASGSPGASPGAASSPGASGAIAGASTSPGPGATTAPGGEASPTTGPTEPAAAGELHLALVADVREPRVGLSTSALAKAIAAGRVAVPCGLDAVQLGDDEIDLAEATCVDAAAIPDAVRATKPRYGLLPAGLVTPRVKVLRVGGADLFGAPSIRTKPYPLTATAAEAPEAWTTFDPVEVRTLISTGDTCPDRGVSHQANTLGKGWDWVLDGGTATYTGIGVDRRFDGPDGNGWPVVAAKRSGNAGAVRALISDAEITLNDFECPMTKSFVQNDTGTIFSIDPQVATLLADAGVDVVTLASNHMTDQGIGALRETLRLFDKNEIARFGAGMTLEKALKPAVVDVNGLRFAFVGFNEIPGSAEASATKPGVAYLNEENVRAGIAAAREIAEVVIVVPQWGWPEYHADFTKRQRQQMRLFWDAGADAVIGHGTHWAGPVAITKGDDGYRVAVGSHGNFLFGQDWSRQTQESVIVELTFVGTSLAQVRLHPYIVLNQAQPNLVDPTTDGEYVLDQVWSNSILR